MAKLNVACIDRERQVYLGMTQVEETEIDAAIHLRQIGECDLPAHEYRWEAIDGHPAGGHFLPLPPMQRAAAGAPTMEHAVAFDLLARWSLAPGQLAGVSLTWLDTMLASLDFQPYRSAPLVTAYATARGLDLGGE